MKLVALKNLCLKDAKEIGREGVFDSKRNQVVFDNGTFIKDVFADGVIPFSDGDKVKLVIDKGTSVFSLELVNQEGHIAFIYIGSIDGLVEISPSPIDINKSYIAKWENHLSALR